MTNSDKFSFNTSQSKALSALGLPLWHKREQNSATQATPPTFCYRADDWLFVANRQLSVTRAQWLIDVLTLLEIEHALPLIEVSANSLVQWPQNRVIDISSEDDGLLLPASKRELWQTLSRHNS